MELTKDLDGETLDETRTKLEQLNLSWWWEFGSVEESIE